MARWETSSRIGLSDSDVTVLRPVRRCPEGIVLVCTGREISGLNQTRRLNCSGKYFSNLCPCRIAYGNLNSLLSMQCVHKVLK